MNAVRYTSGEWYAAVHEGLIAFLSPETLPEIIEQVWASICRGEDIEAQLSHLTSGQASALPPFALVEVAGDRMSSYLRGDVRLTVRGGELESAPGTATEITVDSDSYAPPAVYTGGSTDPWVSLVVHDMDEFWLTAPGPAGGRVSLPVLSAVVHAAEVGLAMERAAQQAGRASSGHSAHSHRADGADGPSGSDDAIAEFDEELDGQTIMDPEYLARLRAQAQQLDQVAATTPPSAPHPSSPPASLPAPTPPSPPVAPAPVAAPVPPLPPAPPSSQVSGPPPPPPPSAARPMQASARMGDEEDHDGLTIMSSDLVAIRAQLPNWKQNAVPGPFTVPTQTPPVKLMMSSGLVVTLDRTVLIGRAPVVSRVSNRDLPRVITVESPNYDISRTHAQVRLEGHRVFVTDLHSTNGVVLLSPGAEPQRLRPGVPTDLMPDTTVDIGDGVTFKMVRS